MLNSKKKKIENFIIRCGFTQIVHYIHVRRNSRSAENNLYVTQLLLSMKISNNWSI